MALPARSQRLELTWFNKDKVLIPSEQGKYGYAWVDPHDPRYCEVHTLVETSRVYGRRSNKVEGTTYSGRDALDPTEDNLLICGESGDVLEALHFAPELASQYVGKIKLCYIDPPFNTEKTFDDYEDNLEHSIWLTMMRDRLLHIRDLLCDEGSIWVHLDDSENHRMRSLLDEVFGAGNFVGEVVWQKADSTRNNNSGKFSEDQDFIMVYRKTGSFEYNRLPRTEEDNVRFTNPDDDPNGPWWDGDPTANKGDGRGGMCYAIQNPLTGEMQYPGTGRHWSLGQAEILRTMNQWAPYGLKNLDDVVKRAENEGISPADAKTETCAIVLQVPVADAVRLVEQRRTNVPLPKYLIRSKGSIGRKMYIPTGGVIPRTWWTNDEVGHNRMAKAEIKALFPDRKPFGTPKPELLLERVIQIGSNPGDIVLDVFAGSGTTAAVAHKMGRRWITAELRADTVERFTLPRLTKVVCGEDPGGVTSTTERTPVANVPLPEGMSASQARDFNSSFLKVLEDLETPVDVAKATIRIVRARVDEEDKTALTQEEAKQLTSLLRKLGKDPEPPVVDLLPDVAKQVRAATKTKDATTVHWRGGGSFRTMALSPSMFDVDPSLGLVVLTEDAHGEALVASIAANLGFTLTPDEPHFHGRLGDMRLLVVEGAVSEETIADSVAVLGEREKVTIAATGVPDGVRAALRQASRGSRVVHVPDDLFTITIDPVLETGEL